MRIGIVSDTHGNRLMVHLALAELRQRGITTILHCGDIDDPETVACISRIPKRRISPSISSRAIRSRATPDARACLAPRSSAG